VDLGTKLHLRRKINGETLKEQSEIFGVSINTIWRWEQGISKPRACNVKKIAHHYGITNEQLFEESNLVHPKSEQQLLHVFRGLSPPNQAKVLNFIDGLKPDYL